MHVKKIILCILSAVGFLPACTVVENVHTYFNKDSIRLVSAKRTEYFEVVIGRGSKLSEVAYKLTGSRNTQSIRAANPGINSEIIQKTSLIRVPTKSLKPNLRLPLKTEKNTPTFEIHPEIKDVKPPEKEKEQKPVKRPVKKTKSPGSDDEEILPEKFEDDKPERTYESVPFKVDNKDVIKYVPPKPTPSKLQAEEERLRNKYRDIMEELD